MQRLASEYVKGFGRLQYPTRLHDLQLTSMQCHALFVTAYTSFHGNLNLSSKCQPRDISEGTNVRCAYRPFIPLDVKLLCQFVPPDRVIDFHCPSLTLPIFKERMGDNWWTIQKLRKFSYKGFICKERNILASGLWGHDHLLLQLALLHTYTFKRKRIDQVN